MDTSQILIITILVTAMAMFLWGHWRHDMVAMSALLMCVITGLIPGGDAFAGFGHPAVITVACVLVLSYGLQISGAVDVLAKHLIPRSAGPTLSILALIGLAALLSGFMNNIGALALLMPVAIQMAAKLNLSAGQVLMPLAFGSILGGMTTLIGTPPNLIVSSYRATTGAGNFAMFDFTLVGATVAVVGVAFVGLIGWHLVPVRRQAGTGSFESGKYLSEVRITEGSKVAEMQLREVDKLLDDVDAQIIGLVRHEVRISAPNPRRTLRVGDILVIEIEPESLPSVLTSLGLKLEEDVPAPAEEPGSNQEEAEPDSVDVGTSDATSAPEETAAAKKQPEEILIQELVVMPNTPLVNRSATDIQLRTRFGINLLAISRQGHRSIKRLRLTRLVAGDVLLMQGSTEAVSGFASEYGCLPLAAREIRVPKKGNALIAATIMGIAVAVTALGILPVAVSFATGVLAFTVFGVIPIRSIYTAIDWPVIVLLGAMLPVAGAMASTGAADLIAQFLLDNVARGQAVAGLVVLLVATMLLTDFMNNVATAAVMCPIAISTASQLGVNADAFLMAIAVGSSCAFLTPIGHQNNTLILGAGGFGFGDFWRMGLPTDVLVIAVSVPMLLWVWPL